ncbi:hypothetical protein KP509_27G059400 [Ceratopteris richardii]|uniref:Uncharacterized protein n=1 Tax=Ceratopteris richardii TaxID=49495 RepID=A0A8T2RJB1_CERRI|nr:hypothetical protein KP509_27G059400 [Ceratopteris richardii]
MEEPPKNIGNIDVQRKLETALFQGGSGLPVISNVPIVGPLVNTLLSPLVLLAVYAYGGYRFMSGFSKNPYADTLTTKVDLTALWPVLFVISQKFRSNFKRVVQQQCKYFQRSLK